MAFVLRSPFGHTMIAIRESERRARFLGISVGTPDKMFHFPVLKFSVLRKDRTGVLVGLPKVSQGLCLASTFLPAGYRAATRAGTSG
jgi:hypothetical protein